MRTRNRPQGFTLIELLVVMAIIALLLSLLLPALSKARAAARQVKDATQIQQVHKGWLIMANDNDGIYPTPGLIDRLPVGGIEIPGRGAEDLSRNGHAELHSACIAAQAYSAQLLVSPSESSGRVAVCSNYDYAAYNPAGDVYWDEVNFKTNLASVCNTSYATIPIAGARKKAQWRNSLDSKFTIVGNRGVQEGNFQDQTLYNRSKTLLIHGSPKKWEGNICYNDGHTAFEDTFLPEGLDTKVNGTVTPDNIFKDDQGNGDTEIGGDCYLVIVRGVQGNEHQLTWD